MGSPEEDHDRQTKNFWWHGTASCPLTYEELLKRANCWTLGADAATATLLQKTSSKLIAGTHEVVSRLQEACGACDRAGVHVTNLTNSFLLLSDAQFVENRTYSEGGPNEMPLVQNDSALPLDQDVIHLQDVGAGLSSCQLAIRNGLDLVNRVHECVQISDSDSESDLEQRVLDSSHNNNPLMILRHVDPYATRHLPHVIGSKLFLEDIWVGLGAPAAPLQDEGTPSPAHDSSEDNSSPIPEVLLQEVTSPCVRLPLHVPPISTKGASVSNEPARSSLFESSSSSDAEGIFTGPLPDTATINRGLKAQPTPPSPSAEPPLLEEPQLQPAPAKVGGAPPLQDFDSSDDGDEFFVPIRKPPLRAPVGGKATCSLGLPPSIGAPPSRRNIFDSSSDDETAIFAPRLTEEPSHPQLLGTGPPFPPLERAPHPPLPETTQSDVISSRSVSLSLPASVEGLPSEPSAISIFSDDEEIDIFAAPPPKNSNIKEMGRDSLFLNDEDIFADITNHPKSNISTFKPIGGDFSAPPLQAHPHLFSDDDEDDLFSIGPPKPKSLAIPVGENGISGSLDSREKVPQSSLLDSPGRRPAGGVALFGGPELLSKLRERRSEGGNPASSPEETHIQPSSVSATEISHVEPPNPEPTVVVTPTGPSTQLDPVPLCPTPVSIGVETGIAFDRESRSTPLLISINKTRPRLQHRRKPPSKKSRRSAGFVDPSPKVSSADHSPTSLFCSAAKRPSCSSYLSSEIQEVQPCESVEKQKKAPVSCVSIFGDDDAGDVEDDLFSSVFPKAELAPKQISLFSEDDDTIFTGPVPPSTHKATPSMEECSLFDEDDDLFSSETPCPQTRKPLETGGSSESPPRHSEPPSSGNHLIPIEDCDDPLSNFLS